MIKKTYNSKAKIISSFISLYKDFDLEKISIRQITDKAAIYRGTFYYYFDDIYDLLETLEKAFLEEAKDFLSTVMDAFFFEDISKYAQYIEAFLEKNLDMIKLFLIYRPRMEYMKKIKNLAKEKSLEKMKLDKKNITREELYIFEYIANAQLGLWIMWLENNRDLSCEDILHLIKEINLKGPITCLVDKTVF